jgi:hypothetical protein
LTALQHIHIGEPFHIVDEQSQQWKGDLKCASSDPLLKLDWQSTIVSSDISLLEPGWFEEKRISISICFISVNTGYEAPVS